MASTGRFVFGEGGPSFSAYEYGISIVGWAREAAEGVCEDVLSWDSSPETISLIEEIKRNPAILKFEVTAAAIAAYCYYALSISESPQVDMADVLSGINKSLTETYPKKGVSMMDSLWRPYFGFLKEDVEVGEFSRRAGFERGRLAHTVVERILSAHAKISKGNYDGSLFHLDRYYFEQLVFGITSGLQSLLKSEMKVHYIF